MSIALTEYVSLLGGHLGFSERLMKQNKFLSCYSRRRSCGKSKKCSKPNAHPGRGDLKRAFHEFWKSSTSHVALKRKGQLNEENRKIEEEAHTKKARLDEVGKYHRVYKKALSFSFFIYLIRTELYVNNLYKLIFYFIF